MLIPAIFVSMLEHVVLQLVHLLSLTVNAILVEPNITKFEELQDLLSDQFPNSAVVSDPVLHPPAQKDASLLEEPANSKRYHLLYLLACFTCCFYCTLFTLFGKTLLPDIFRKFCADDTTTFESELRQTSQLASRVLRACRLCDIMEDIGYSSLASHNNFCCVLKQ